MNIYLTTDTHFSHTQLIEYGRPKNFEERIKKWLLQIKKADILIHLWDVCIGEDKINNNWFRFINCRRILVRGNHDRKSINRYMNNWRDFVCDRFDMKVWHKKICFTHKPVVWDWEFDYNIHWHFHDTQNRNQEDSCNITWYHKLLALEYTDYKPVNLEKFLTN